MIVSLLVIACILFKMRMRRTGNLTILKILMLFNYPLAMGIWISTQSAIVSIGLLTLLLLLSPSDLMLILILPVSPGHLLLTLILPRQWFSADPYTCSHVSLSDLLYFYRYVTVYIGKSSVNGKLSWKSLLGFTVVVKHDLVWFAIEFWSNNYVMLLKWFLKYLWLGAFNHRILHKAS